MVVDEFLSGKEIQDTVLVSNKKLWIVIPKQVAFTYITDEECKNEAETYKGRICKSSFL